MRNPSRRSCGAILAMPAQITVAASIDEAVTLIGAGDYDVALVDSGAQDSRGLELIHDGLALHPYRPFILMTASQDPGLPLVAFHAGAVDFFAKRISRPTRCCAVSATRSIARPPVGPCSTPATGSAPIS